MVCKRIYYTLIYSPDSRSLICLPSFHTEIVILFWSSTNIFWFLPCVISYCGHKKEQSFVD